MAVKKLFGVLNTKTGKIVDDKYYDNKMVAKKVRDELRETASDETYLLIPGPDHYKYRG